MYNLFFELSFVILLSISTTGLIIFIDFCFQEGNILYFYYKRISRIKNKKVAKVLGKCIICFGFWVNLIIFIIFVVEFQLNILFFIPFIGLNEGLLIIYKNLFYEN